MKIKATLECHRTANLPGKTQLHHGCIEHSEQPLCEEELDLQLHPATLECAQQQSDESHFYTHRSYQQPPEKQQQHNQ
jgi:hypothetical protein